MPKRKTRPVSDAELKDFVDRRLACTEIARILECHRYSAVNILKKRPIPCEEGRTFYDAWKKGREELEEEKRPKEEKPTMDPLSHLRMISQGSSAITRALEYHDSINPSRQSISMRKLIRLFLRYEQALRNDEEPTFGELAKYSGISGHNVVSRILRKIGLPSFHRNNSRHFIDASEDELIRRCLGVRMPVTDIARFLETGSVNVRRRIVNGRLEYSPFILRLDFKEGEFLTYFLSSRIYYLYDVRMLGLADISERLKLNPVIVDVALERRAEISQPIVEILRLKYDDPSINKPYIKEQKKLS